MFYTKKKALKKFKQEFINQYLSDQKFDPELEMVGVDSKGMRWYRTPSEIGMPIQRYR